MQLKPAFSLTPLVLCLAAGSAHADLSPYSFGASETIQHMGARAKSDLRRFLK